MEANGQNPKKEGILGGSLLLKIILLIAVLLIASVLFFGVEFTLPSILWALIRIIIGLAFLVAIFKILQSLTDKHDFSPTTRFKEKMVRVAKLSKPFNVRELYLRGEDMRVYSKWGKITGLAFIPYLASKLKVDKDGSFTYEQKKDKEGNLMTDEDGKKIMVNKTDILTEKDGDWFIVTERGIPFFKQKDIIRCHHSLVSEIGERIWIKTPNLVPIGDYHYPCQQWQEDIKRIHVQHQSEALIETYQEFLDLIANITQMTLNADPNFQKLQQHGIEQVGQEESSGLVKS